MVTELMCPARFLMIPTSTSAGGTTMSSYATLVHNCDLHMESAPGTCVNCWTSWSSCETRSSGFGASGGGRNGRHRSVVSTFDNAMNTRRPRPSSADTSQLVTILPAIGSTTTNNMPQISTRPVRRVTYVCLPPTRPGPVHHRSYATSPAPPAWMSARDGETPDPYPRHQPARSIRSTRRASLESLRRRSGTPQP